MYHIHVLYLIKSDVNQENPPYYENGCFPKKLKCLESLEGMTLTWLRSPTWDAAHEHLWNTDYGPDELLRL
jgi:hypothetical protein